MTIASLIVDVAANTAQLRTDVAQVNSTLDGMSGALASVGSMMAGAFSVSAISAYAKEVIDLGGQLQDMKARTGMSVDALQVLGRVAELTGSNLETLVSAINQMQKRIAGGDDSAEAALRKLGISLADIRDKSPDQQFRLIAAAISEIKNPSEQVNAAWALFGKAAGQILPALKEDIDKVAAATTRMSDQTSSELDAAGDAATRFWGNYKAEFASGIAEVLRNVSSWQGAWEGLQIMLGNVNAGVQRDMRLTVEDTKRMGDEFKRLTPAMTEPLKNGEQAFTATEAAMKKYIAEQEGLKKSQKEAADAAKKHNDELKRLESQFLGMAANWEKSVTSVWNPERPKTLEESLRGVGLVFNDLNEDLFKTQIGIDGSAASMRNLGDYTMNELAPGMEYMGEQGKNYFDYGPQLSSAKTSFQSFGDVLKGSITNIPKTFGSIQQSLSTKLSGLFGAAPNSVMSSVISGGMNFVFGPLSGLASQLMQKGMEALGKIAWEGLKKIGGFFKDLFGGPDKDELAGRSLVSSFESNIASMLTQQQKLEAGGESWKQTVIGIRDKYLALGLSEQQALDDAKRLWDSSKQGPEAAKKVIDEITAKMKGVGAAAKETADTLSGQLGGGFEDGSVSADDMAQEVKAQLEKMMASGQYTADEIAEAQRQAAMKIKQYYEELARTPIRIPIEVYSSNGGVIDPVPAMASGGVVTRPTLALIGEAGPEAVVPLSQYNSGGGGDIYIEVVNVVDGYEVSRSVNRYQSRDLRMRRKVAAA